MINIVLSFIALFLIILGLLLLLFVCFIENKSSKKIVLYKNNGKYAILIPARNESKVIENLLISIENQTYKVDSKDVYVIVEDECDKTVSIANNHNVSVIIRTNLENRKRKGYALADAIENISTKYDAYFIFDADNILDKNFIKEMSKTINEGYDIGIGYRNTKNGSSTLTASASALTFSMINTFINRKKVKRHNNVIISGTGYYIKGSIVDKWGTFPFNSLTEDYELSLDATLNGYTTYYNESAIYYDEQPEKYKVSIIQRTRWIKGYFEARKKYIPKLKNSIITSNENTLSKVKEVIGVIPFILIIPGIIIYSINLLILNLQNNTIYKFIYLLIGIILGIYILLVLFTAYLLILEKNKLNISKKNKVLVVLFNPIFLLSYVRCLLICILKKDVSWQEIKHEKTNIE